MSKSDFEIPKEEFAENVEGSSSSEAKNEKEAEFGEEAFVFSLNHVVSFTVLFAGYLADMFISELTNTMNSAIEADLGEPPNNFFWILTIPILIGSFLALVVGRASDMFGRKYLQIGASIFGIIGSSIAIRSNSMRVLMVSSGIYSIGYSGHQLALTSIVETLPRKYRAVAIGIFFGALIPATGFATLIGAALTLHSSWRAIFWLALGLYIFSAVGTLLFYHPSKLPIQEKGNLNTRLKEFDYVGGFLMLAGGSTMAIGLVFGGTVFPWISVGCLLPTFLGAAVAFVFNAYMWFTKKTYPIVPPSFRGRYWKMFVLIFFLGMVGSTTKGMWPIQAQILYAPTPLKLGAYTAPYGLISCVMSPIAGFLFFPKYSHWIIIVCCAVLFIFSCCQVIVGRDTAAASTVLTAFSGALHGFLTVFTTAMIQLTVDHKDLGAATSLSFSAFTFGGVAYGIIDQIMMHDQIKKQAKERIAPSLYRAGIPLAKLPAAVTAFLAGQITNPVFATASPAGLIATSEALKDAYVHILHFVYLVSILFGALMLFSSAVQRGVKEPITSHIDVRLGSLRWLVRSRNRAVQV